MTNTNPPNANNEAVTNESSHPPVFDKTNEAVIDISSDDDVVSVFYIYFENIYFYFLLTKLLCLYFSLFPSPKKDEGY